MECCLTFDNIRIVVVKVDIKISSYMFKKRPEPNKVLLKGLTYLVLRSSFWFKSTNSLVL